MTRKKRKKKGKVKLISLVYLIASIIFIIAILNYNNIENFLRYIIIGIILFTDLITLFNIRHRHSTFSNALKFVFIVLFIFLSVNLNKISHYVTKVNKKVTYSTSLITRIDGSEKVGSSKLGMIKNTESKEGYVLANKIIKENKLDNNEIIYYEDYRPLITALYNKEIDYIFLPTDYENLFSNQEGFEDIKHRVKIIKTVTMEEKKIKNNSTKKLTKPFSVLLMGIDSTTSGFKNSDSFNGDSLILLTVNPKTMNATMLSIHRDSYVPIMCFDDKRENKITHAASHGTQCVLDTVENYLDVKVDYYVKINFTGVVDLVNALGGLELDVPHALCEQDSKRRIGKNIVYIEKGKQVLNGEQVLAFARNRKKNEDYCPKKYTEGYRDVSVRNKNQEAIINALIEKGKTIKDINKIYELLDILTDNLDTNMDRDTILSFYDVAKSVMSDNNQNRINIEKLLINGHGQMIYDEKTRLTLWEYIPVKQSVEVCKKEMRANLELEDNNITEFSYTPGQNIDHVIGSEFDKSDFYPLVPNFYNMSLEEAKKWAEENDITLKINYVKNTNYKNGRIYSQDYPYRKRIDKIDDKTITITVADNL